MTKFLAFRINLPTCSGDHYVISPNNMSGFYTRKVLRRKKNTNLRILFLLCTNSSKVEFHKKINVPFLWQFQLDVEN